MKARVFVLLILLLVSPGDLGCTTMATEADLPRATRPVELRRLGLSEKDTPTVVPDRVVRDTASPEESAGAAVVALEPFVDEAMGIRGVTPVGWWVTGPGVRARDDLTRIVQRTGPGGSAAGLAAEAMAQLGLDSLPDNAKSYRTSALNWKLYAIRVEAQGVGAILVDLALAESEDVAYVVLFQSVAKEHESLRETVFLPAVDALGPLS